MYSCCSHSNSSNSSADISPRCENYRSDTIKFIYTFQLNTNMKKAETKPDKVKLELF